MIVGITRLKEVRHKYRDKRLVLAGGVFDLLHEGHIRHFRQLAKFGDVVAVAISSDQRARERKGPNRPINGQRTRAVLVEAVKGVDLVIKMPKHGRLKDFPTMRIIKLLRPDIFVSSDKRWDSHRDEFNLLGVELVILPREKVNSTTRIINKIVNCYSANKNET